jgi:hypothetical protein
MAALPARRAKEKVMKKEIYKNRKEAKKEMGFQHIEEWTEEMEETERPPEGYENERRLLAWDDRGEKSWYNLIFENRETGKITVLFPD